MADTLTSKGLTLLDPPLNYDVGKFNANTQKINDMIGAVICTSTTRPSTGLFDGMTLWETDTQRIVVRVSAAWVAVPQRIVVANQAARDAIVTKYNGMLVYRQDVEWHEVYDGASWRVQGTVSTSSLANITSPLTGQCAILTSDNYMYRWTGSAWTAVSSQGNVSYIDYSRSTDQSIPNGASTKVSFTVTNKSSADMSAAVVGSGTEFTVNRAGRWFVETNGGLAGSAVGTLRAWWIGNVSDSARYAMGGSGPQPFLAAFSVGREITMAAGDKFSIFAYQDTGGALNTLISQAPINVSARWMGPT